MKTRAAAVSPSGSENGMLLLQEQKMCSVQQDRDASLYVLLDWISQQRENTWGAINLILWWSAEHLLLDDSQGHSSLQPPPCPWSHTAYSLCHFAQRIGIKSGTWFCNSKCASRVSDSCLRQLVLAFQPLGRKLHPREQTEIPALLGKLRDCPKAIPCVLFSVLHSSGSSSQSRLLSLALLYLPSSWPSLRPQGPPSF